MIDVLAQKDKSLLLTEDEWTHLNEIVKVLRHPYHVTQLLQRVNFTLSDFYAAWLELQFVLQEIFEKDSTNKLAESILNATNEDKHEHLIRNPSLLCSVFLDPRVKSALLCDRKQSDVAMKHLSELYNRLKRIENDNNQPSGSLDDLDSSDDKISAYSKISEYMTHLERSAPVGESSKRDKKPDIYQLLNDFSKIDSIPMNISILEYWEKKQFNFPELFELAKIVHAAPVTEASVERTFSILRFVFSALRGNLAEELLEDIMLIQENKDLFYEVASEELRCAESTP